MQNVKYIEVATKEHLIDKGIEIPSPSYSFVPQLGQNLAYAGTDVPQLVHKLPP